jgi:phosphatidylserine decarboxylase
MKAANSFIIAKEGFKAVSLVALVVIVILLFSENFLLKLFALIAFGIVLFVFKNPERSSDRFESGAIMSVCDGIVSNIETIECKGKIKGECYKITITNRLIDSGVLRVPFRSEFALNEMQRGVQLAAHSPKALSLNEQAKVMFVQEHSDKNKIVVKHYLNRFSTAISLYPSVGQETQMGSRYGFMFHGTVLIFLPSYTRLDIKKGDELRAGETIIGFFSTNA